MHWVYWLLCPLSSDFCCLLEAWPLFSEESEHGLASLPHSWLTASMACRVGRGDIEGGSQQLTHRGSSPKTPRKEPESSQKQNQPLSPEAHLQQINQQAESDRSFMPVSLKSDRQAEKPYLTPQKDFWAKMARGRDTQTGQCRRSMVEEVGRSPHMPGGP